MILYIIIFLTAVFFFYVSEKIDDNKFKNILVVLLIFALCLITGTRLVGGSDYDVYKRGYEMIKPLSNFDMSVFSNGIVGIYGLDVGYSLVQSIFKTFGLTFQQFTLCISMFFYFSVYYNFKKINANMIFLIIVFMYKAFLDLTFVYMRQSIAVAVFLFAFPHLFDRNLKKYIIFTLLATLFHSSALALLLLYPFTKLHLTKKAILWYSIILIPTYFFTYMNINVLNNPLFNAFISMESLSKKVFYFSDNANVYRINILHLIEYIAILVPIYLHFDELKRINNKMEIIINIFLFILPLYTILSGSEIFIRIKWYIILVNPVIIYSFKYIRFKYKNIFILCTIILCFFGMIKFALSFDNGKGVGEYKSYLLSSVEYNKELNYK